MVSLSDGNHPPFHRDLHYQISVTLTCALNFLTDNWTKAESFSPIWTRRKF